MSRCLDMDSLVTIGAALDWKAEEALHHLMECENCQVQLRQLTALHDALAEKAEPAPGFSDEVVGTLVRQEVRTPARSWTSRLVEFLNPALAGLTVFFAIGFVASEQSTMLLGAPTFFASLLVAGLTGWWNWSHRSAAAKPTATT